MLHHQLELWYVYMYVCLYIMSTLDFEKRTFIIYKRNFTLVDHFHFLVNIHLNGTMYNLLVILKKLTFV